MQILIFSIFILLIVIYVIYKIKKSFTKKEFFTFIGVTIIAIATFIFYNKSQESKLPNAFKEKYFNEKNIEILKLSINQTNIEVLNSDSGTYDFIYIIQKDDKEYVCEAKDVEVQKVEDIYVFKNFKEECRLK